MVEEVEKVRQVEYVTEVIIVPDKSGVITSSRNNVKYVFEVKNHEVKVTTAQEKKILLENVAGARIKESKEK